MADKDFNFQLETINKAASRFLEENSKFRKFAFYGVMGAGKTTFITALCRILKATDLVSSPTFSIVNEYSTEPGEVIYHFDFYRIKSSEELYDIGFEEYNQNSAWCFIEWPEKAEDLLSDEFIRVELLVDENGERSLKYK